MKKKLVAILLMFVIALLPLTVMAEGEEKPAPTYYRMNIYEASDKSGAKSMDFMILDDKVYIHAEKLAEYLGYKFMQSWDECSFFKDDANYSYMFLFDSTDVMVYLSGNMIYYDAPYENKFIDDVAWIPFNFTCALFGVSDFAVDDGKILVKPDMSIFDVLVKFVNSTYPYQFSWLDEVGFDDAAVQALSGNSKLALCMDNWLSEWGWGSIIDLDTDYNDLWVREIADLFVMPSEEEVKGHARINQEVNDVVVTIGQLEKIDNVISFVDGAVENTEAGAFVASEITGELTPKKWDNLKKLLKKRFDDATFNKKFSKAYKSYTRTKSVGEISDIMSKAADKWSDATDIADSPVSFLDLVSWSVQLTTYHDKFVNRDETAVKALQKYAKTNTKDEMVVALSNYADKMTTDSSWIDALFEFAYRDGGSVIDDLIPFEVLADGWGSAFKIGYNIAKGTIPFIGNSLASMENFEYANYAIHYQNDCAWRYYVAKELCFFDRGIIDESWLKELCDRAYTVLKFSLIARQCAIDSVDKNYGYDKKRKSDVLTEMRNKNNEIGMFLAVLSQAEENNDHGVYGLLPSDCNNFWEDTKDEEARTKAFIEALGKEIDNPTQKCVPDMRVNMKGYITEEEAIEIVRNLMNSMGGMEYLSYFYEGEIYTYEIAGTYKVIKDDGTDADTYIVAMYYEDSLSGMFFVTGDGSEVWMGEYDSDEDEYMVMYQINLLDFDMYDLFELLLEGEMYLFENY